MKSLFALIVLLSMSFTAQAQADFSEEVRNTWGVNLGFGTAGQATSTSTLRVITPGYVKFSDGGWIRFYGDLLGRNFSAAGSTDSESLTEFSLGVQVESPVMKDMFGFYTRIGVGGASMPDAFYDGNIIILPISIGFNLYARTKETQSWHDPVIGVEYRTSVRLNYDEEKETVSNADSLLSPGLYLNVGWLF